MSDIRLPSEWKLELGARDLASIAAALDAELDRGLDKTPGADLAMLPAYVGVPARSAHGHVLCLDAGGTNVRGAPVTVTPEEVSVGAIRHAPLPGITTAVGRAEFFRGLAQLIAPEAARARRVGFCFSYPAEVLPDGDAVLLRWTKEVRAAGVEGRRVGEGLQEALAALGRRRRFRIVVLNDTVTTLVASTRDARTLGCIGHVGVVVGTGTNMATFVPAARARRRAPTWRGGPLAFNLESGNFRGFPRGALDEGLARRTSDPGRQWLEKAVSGHYLGELCFLALRDLEARGAGPRVLARGVRTLPPPTTAELSRVVAGQRGDGPWERHLAADREALRWMRAVSGALLHRSAQLVGAGLGALVRRHAAAATCAGPVAIAAEGAVFFGVPGYRDTVLATIAAITTAPVRLVRIEEANLRGAALAALTRPPRVRATAPGTRRGRGSGRRATPRR
jgi:hexokinase